MPNIPLQLATEPQCLFFPPCSARYHQPRTHTHVGSTPPTGLGSPLPPHPSIHMLLSQSPTPAPLWDLCSGPPPEPQRWPLGSRAPGRGWARTSCPRCPLDSSQDSCCSPSCRKGGRQEGRHLRPFPQKHVLRREKQCSTGPAAGGPEWGRGPGRGPGPAASGS